MELLQLSRERPIPVHDEQKPLTQFIHRTGGGAETLTYHKLPVLKSSRMETGKAL